MSRRGRFVVLGLGAAALGVLGAFSPWIYGRIRREVLLSRLERGDDPAARRELAQMRRTASAHERLVATRSEALARNLVELARDDRLDGPTRRDAFELLFPASFTEQAVKDGAPVILPPPGQLYVTCAKSSMCDVVAAGHWQKPTYRAEGPREGGEVEEYMEYFVTGEGPDTRLVYQRCSWVVFPPGAKTLSERMRVETQDLTDLPDPLNLFPGKPGKAVAPGGGEAVELFFGSMGTWRSFIPGRRLFDRSVSYAIFLDGAEPHFLGNVAVSAETGRGRWFAEDATRGKPVENLERGAHWVSFLVPASAARLEAFARFRLLFRPAPAFAEKRGFKVPAADSPAFEREYYLPAWEK